MSAISNVADDLAAEMVNGLFSTDFTPERSYADEDMELTAAGELRVDVVIVGEANIELHDRAHLGADFILDIGVRYKFGTDEQGADGRIANDAVAPYELLLQELLVFVAKKRLTDAVWKGSEVRTRRVNKHLREWKQFTGILRVTFRGTIAL